MKFFIVSSLLAMFSMNSFAATHGCGNIDDVSPQDLLKTYDLSIELTDDAYIEAGQGVAAIYIEGRGGDTYLEAVGLEAKEVSQFKRRIKAGTVFEINPEENPREYKDQTTRATQYKIKGSPTIARLSLTIYSAWAALPPGFKFNPLHGLLDKGGSFIFRCNPKNNNDEVIDVQ